jgi:hypothetical protein
MSYFDVVDRPEIQDRISEWVVDNERSFPYGLSDDAEIWDIIDNYVMSLEEELRLLKIRLAWTEMEVKRAATTHQY